MTDFSTTPETIIDELSETLNGMKFIPEAKFQQLKEEIESYSSFQCGMEMAGEDL